MYNCVVEFANIVCKSFEGGSNPKILKNEVLTNQTCILLTSKDLALEILVIFEQHA